jgi:CheY-like chemotaxis protein
VAQPTGSTLQLQPACLNLARGCPVLSLRPGVGITRDGLATLFREYVQGTDDEMCKPRTRGGTGLGLSICSKQVGVLGGVIGAYSCRSHGSTFWFRIPVRTGKLHRAGSNTSTGSPAAARGQQQQAAQQQQGVLASSNPALLAKWAASQQQQDLQPFLTQRQAQQGDHMQSALYRLTSEDLAKQQQGGAAGGNAAAAAASGSSQQASSADVLGSSSSSSGLLPPQAPGPPTGAAAAAAAVAAAAAPASRVAPRQLSLDGRAPSVLDTSRLLGARVLLAEDNLINQTVARKMLSSIGMQVEVAANGVEAVAAVRRTRPPPPAAAAASGENSSSSSSQPPPVPFSIVLMDMAMPVMGGVDATRLLREEGFNLPIVAMTANASDKDRDECAAAGMNGFLSKPVLRDQLARAVLAAVQEHDVLTADDVGNRGTATATAAGSR